jgi:hypothetical protein
MISVQLVGHTAVWRTGNNLIAEYSGLEVVSCRINADNDECGFPIRNRSIVDSQSHDAALRKNAVEDFSAEQPGPNGIFSGGGLKFLCDCGGILQCDIVFLVARYLRFCLLGERNSAADERERNDDDGAFHTASDEFEWGGMTSSARFAPPNLRCSAEKQCKLGRCVPKNRQKINERVVPLRLSPLDGLLFHRG